MPTDDELAAMPAEECEVLDRWDAEETRRERDERDAELAKEYEELT